MTTKVTRQRRRWLVWLRRIVGITGLVFGIGAPFLLVFPYWVLVIEFREPLTRLATRLGGRRAFVLFGWVGGMLIEVFAVLDNLGKPYDERALFHPVPGPDLLLSAWYYLFFALTWLVVLQRWQFSSKQVVLVSAAYGVIVEQDFLILGQLFTSPLGWLVAAVVGLHYASFVGPVHLVTRDHFSATREPRWYHFVLVIVLLFVVGHGLFIVAWIPVLAAFPNPV